MKIYQIHRHSIEWGDYSDYIEYSYTSKEKAELKLKELELHQSQIDMCSDCPIGKISYYSNITDEKINIIDKCSKCDIQKVKNENTEYWMCRNDIGDYDVNWFTLEEIDVIE